MRYSTQNLSIKSMTVVAMLFLAISLMTGLECPGPTPTPTPTPMPTYCGDGTCDPDETCSTCPSDCGVCPSSCGDGTCAPYETCSTCPSDCGVCPSSCGDGTCAPHETCSTCPSDCGVCSSFCGDGTCDPYETCSTCPSDCGSCGGTGETLTIDLGSGVTMDLIKILASTFQMGDISGNGDSDEQPVHTVTISQDFYMGKYEVTQAQYQAVMGTAPWSGQFYVIDQDNAAGSYLSWNDAQAFCSAVQSQTGYALRLPSEAEWEYACRAGSTTKYSFGDDASQLGDYAWWDGNAWSVGEPYSHAVGQKLSNDFGLYDMHGNVWEWCEDDWHANYNGAPSDGSAWDDGTSSYRVLRGGSWSSDDYYCRSANRGRNTPDSRYHYDGFRVSLSDSGHGQ